MDTPRKTEASKQKKDEIILSFELAKIFQGYLEGKRTREEVLEILKKRYRAAHGASRRSHQNEVATEMETADAE